MDVLPEKRSRRPPEAFEMPERRPPPQKEKPSEKKRKVSGCNYEIIPIPQKHQDEGEVFLLYGVLHLLFPIQISFISPNKF